MFFIDNTTARLGFQASRAKNKMTVMLNTIIIKSNKYNDDAAKKAFIAILQTKKQHLVVSRRLGGIVNINKLNL